MRYPDDLIQRVKESTDIVAVVGESVRLKKAGTSWKGLCPFHQEKTPSFVVSPARGSWHCFGCGKGGNVFTFLMEFAGLSFPEALKALADRAGISLPRLQRSQAGEILMQERERLLALNEAAGEFYAGLLFSPEGKEAREYLKGRGFDGAWAKKYRVGYAPPAWDRLKAEARGWGYSEEELVAAGLAVRHAEKGIIYDKFRNRVVFPVCDYYGKIVGFGGRTLLDDEGPKYLNSPETILFKKGEILYLLDIAREAIRRSGRVLVVEGYFDALAPHHRGVENVVATLGTALTSAHARALKRYAGEAVLVFDADAAGRAATLRAAEPLLAEGLRVRVLMLPEGAKDPDEYLAKHPRDAFLALVEAAPDFFRWRAAALGGKLRGKPVEDRLHAVRELLSLAAKLPDEASVQAACAAAADALGLDPRDVTAQANALRRGAALAPSTGGSGKGAARPPNPDREAEGEFLALLSREDGKFVPWAREELEPSYFTQEDLRQLFEAAFREGFDPAVWREAPALEPWFLRMEERPGGYRNLEGMLVERAAALRQRALLRRMKALDADRRAAEAAGEVERAAEVAREISRLKHEATKETRWR